MASSSVPARGPRAALSAAAAVLALGWTSGEVNRVGVTWDEPYYFSSAVRIQDWTARVLAGPDRRAELTRERIAETWDWAHYWNPHPPIYKQAMAFTEWASGERLGSVRGFRIASLLFFGLLVGAVAWVAAAEWGLAAGAVAATSLLLMPRVAGHANVAATDTPLSLFWLAGTIGTLRFLQNRRPAALAVAAIGLGLAMGTKFTGLLLPLPLIAWAVLYRRRPATAVRLVTVVAGGAALFYLLNPLAWHDPIGYLGGLIADSTGREEVIPISTYYLGRSYGYRVPWHHGAVMTLVTVPLTLLVLALWGAGAGLTKWRRDPIAVLCLIEIAFFWALLALPSSPNHDGVRLFLPMFPFVALLAGRGWAVVWGALRRRLAGQAAILAGATAVLVLLVPAHHQRVRTAPYYLSYYNEVIGGVRGAAERGMEITYWYDALTPAFLARLNEVLPPGAVMATFPSQDYFLGLQALGLLRQDIHISDTIPAPYFLIYGRRGMFTPIEWGIYRDVRPLISVELDGVELAGLYMLEPAPAGDGTGEGEGGVASQKGRRSRDVDTE